MKQASKYPASIIIFGAKGDLTRRKLIPALYNLYTGHFLPQAFRIFCVDYIDLKRDDFLADLRAGVNEFSRKGASSDKQWKTFATNVQYYSGDFLKEETFINLGTALDQFDTENKSKGSRLFYFAVAPKFIETISDALYHLKLANQKQLDRLVIEKPFGTDFTSARNLNKFLTQRFYEKQLYRIDHYLGKETVQNIMAFRFANHLFEPLWNNKFIDHVQISVAEQVSVGKRGGYYENSGALRDMVQNHLIQLLCVIAMECPERYDAEIIRDAKVEVIKNLKPYSVATVFNNVVRGQYTAGKLNGSDQVAYRNEENIPSKSTTETYVALKLFIENKRWKGVPFYLRTGKSLKRQTSLITIQFKDTPHKIFRDDIVPNRLIISIQPELEIRLLFESKVPGLEMKLKPVDMDFTYKEAYSEEIPEAYEALLLDVLLGDATQFMRADQVEEAWKFVMPILDTWKKYPAKQLQFYEAGSWGPKAAKNLLKPHAKDWILLEGME